MVFGAIGDQPQTKKPITFQLRLGNASFSGAARRAISVRRSRIPVCSTTRVKSAIVFSLMVDGSGPRGCRIFGRLRPVRMVRSGTACWEWNFRSLSPWLLRVRVYLYDALCRPTRIGG